MGNYNNELDILKKLRNKEYHFITLEEEIKKHIFKQ